MWSIYLGPALNRKHFIESFQQPWDTPLGRKMIIQLVNRLKKRQIIPCRELYHVPSLILFYLFLKILVLLKTGPPNMTGLHSSAISLLVIYPREMKT